MRNFRGAALALTIGASVLMASANADARSVYRWETDEGVISFADELKRVPERYRDQVKRVETKTLTSTKRFSKMAEPAEAAYADQVAARLEHLRLQNGEPAPASPAVSNQPVPGMALSSLRRRGGRLRQADQVTPTLNLGAVDEAPVVVEEIRTRSDARSPHVTRRVTVVRQGDKILAVIKPARRSYGMDLPYESELSLER